MPISDSGRLDRVEFMAWDMFVKLLDHLSRGLPITEEDVAFLLPLFGCSPAMSAKERWERIDDIITTGDSLKWAALHYGKDPRTIRNWCKKGWFPSAYRSPGGHHWRIPFNTISEAETHLTPGLCRKPKSLLGSKDWVQLKPKLKSIFRGVKAAYETHAGIRDLSNRELRGERPKVSLEAVDMMLHAYEAGHLSYMQLRLAARRIQAGDPTRRITRKMLARETGMSVAGLYRHFGAERIARVIGWAEQPLVSDDGDAKALEPLNEVGAIFSSFEGFDRNGFKVDFTENLVAQIPKRTPKRGKSTG
jgi:hypothetical protein